MRTKRHSNDSVVHGVLAGIFVVVLFYSIVMAVIFLAGGARAQEHMHRGDYGVDHGPMHAWYKGLHNKQGGSCCNGGDCRPTEHRIVGEKVQVLLDGEWVDVPADKLLEKNAPDMGSHVCAPPKEWDYNAREGGQRTIWCVILGSGV